MRASEVLALLMVAAIVARIVLPIYEDAAVRSATEAVLAEVHAVRAAALSYHDEHGDWPSTAAAGVLPAGLAPYLPDGFSFVRPDYTLAWHNWHLPEGHPGDPGTTRLVGISLKTDDSLLGERILARASGDATVFNLSDHYTMLITDR